MTEPGGFVVYSNWRTFPIPAAERAVSDPTGTLRARLSSQYRCMVFVLEGEIDARTAPWLTEQLLGACRERTGDALVLVLRHLSFFGAAGLQCLNTVAETAARRDVRVSLWDPPPFARRVLRAGDLHPSVLVEPPA
ncbi:STAS domain-containing protein [Cryptosporangium arvum]|uniref:Anti-anti-sigma regulatory factor (Antagonist of anti-sigma factor) n=1 Tax=Cryptosporangium arvum DSM 44712 TaxID=927661 RepID=A0A010ZT37_9ACTN|nr:STAS domain-containing protein [Cryptosporangium arvum]EXG81854.1 anti-anti-sigma regulatory factor (antagonist of anti-sigma factor) [Cryptosporangium arvum DSM 44712]